MTGKFCKDLLGQLKNRNLDPVLQQLQGEAGAKLSFGDIVGAYGRIEGDYDNKARGAKDVIAAVFYEFHEVSYFSNTIIIIIIIKRKSRPQ